MRKPHSHRLRSGRFSEANRTYSVTTCCIDRRSLLAPDPAARIVVDEMLAREREGGCTSLAYVIMPDHVHWLLQLQPGHELSAIVARTKGRAAVRINRSRRTQGRLWQPGYHDHAVRREEDLENLANYLILNPVRAGLAATPERYPHWWSTWHPRNRA